jgi:hypothetical protein
MYDERLTMRENLAIAYMESVISLDTYLFFIKYWRIDLYNNVFKN